MRLEWVSELRASGLSASRVRQAHTVFSSMLKAAVRDRRIGVNPADVDLPRLPPRSHTYLTHEKVDALADACGRYRTLVLTLAYCGLRFGEAAALRVCDVDTMRGRLRIEHAMAGVNGEAVFGDTKTHQRRSAPVPAFLRESLAVEIAGKASDALVFTSARGGVLRNNNFRRDAFDAAAIAVGLDGLAPHALRHTAASLAISTGANVKALQSMLGHRSASVTLDVYAGLFGDDLDAVASSLDTAHEQIAKQTRTKRGPNVVDLAARRAARAR
jgi:integrase